LLHWDHGVYSITEILGASLRHGVYVQTQKKVHKYILTWNSNLSNKKHRIWRIWWIWSYIQTSLLWLLNWEHGVYIITQILEASLHQTQKNTHLELPSRRKTWTFKNMSLHSNFVNMIATLGSWGLHNHWNIRGKFTSDPPKKWLGIAISQKKIINFWRIWPYIQTSLTWLLNWEYGVYTITEILGTSLSCGVYAYTKKKILTWNWNLSWKKTLIFEEFDLIFKLL